MTDAAILTEQLTKRYGMRAAVDSLDLEVHRGEVFGFLGPNGAGKTTTIAMLLGLVRPTSGRALVLGHDIAGALPAALRKVGAMIEAPAFYPYLTGYDNLRVVARTRGVREQHIPAVLDLVELEGRGRDRVQTYSQGMKQRLAIAATLLGEPDLIMLDEPTNGLDPAGTVEIRELIRTLAAGGRTIFLCSHQLHEVEQVCERVAILKEGRLLARGSVRELLRRGRGLQVRIAGPLEPALTVLAGLDWIGRIERDQNMLLIDAPAERAAELNSLLARAGVAVAELRERDRSLEAFFLEVTADR